MAEGSEDRSKTLAADRAGAAGKTGTLIEARTRRGRDLGETRRERWRWEDRDAETPGRLLRRHLERPGRQDAHPLDLRALRAQRRRPAAPADRLRRRGRDQTTDERLRDGALGFGLSRNVRRAYRFVRDHWQPGDELFVLGFSRGADTARSLCGFLGRVGWLDGDDWVDRAYICDGKAGMQGPSGHQEDGGRVGG